MWHKPTHSPFIILSMMNDIHDWYQRPNSWCQNAFAYADGRPTYPTDPHADRLCLTAACYSAVGRLAPSLEQRSTYELILFWEIGERLSLRGCKFAPKTVDSMSRIVAWNEMPQRNQSDVCLTMETIIETYRKENKLCLKLSS
jgi:hypothetical protein